MPQFALIDYVIFFLAGCSRDNEPKITFYDLFEILRKKGPLKPTNVESRQILLHKISEVYNKPLWDDAYVEKIKSKLLSFTVMLDKKWTENNRTYDRFIEKNREWIKKDFMLPPENENSCAAKYQISGKRSVSKLFKESIKSPNRAKKIMKSYTCIENAKPIPYTIDEALAFLIENKLTKQQYVNIRINSKNRNCDIYPPYDDIIDGEKKCYKNSKINNNEDLLHMLCVSSDPVISSLRNVPKKNLLKLSNVAQNLISI